MVPFPVTLSNPICQDHGVIFKPIDALSVLCAPLTRGLLATAISSCLNVSIRRVKQESKSSFVCMPIANWSVISHGGRIIRDIIHINTYLRVSSQPVRHTCSLYYGHSS